MRTDLSSSMTPPLRKAGKQLARIIHDFASQKGKGALKEL
jgi:hypothetical protein